MSDSARGKLPCQAACRKTSVAMEMRIAARLGEIDHMSREAKTERNAKKVQQNSSNYTKSHLL